MKRKKIILDCDPGHDDAIAILVAHAHELIELLGITVVSGNQTLEKTGINTLNICQYLNIEVPVCLGASEPLIKPRQVCPDIHGETGLDGFDFPPLERDFDPRKAVDFINDVLTDSQEKITIVTTGPMTNLALALKLYPDIKTHIEEVVLMGGSYQHGNVSPAAEFNIYADPEAAYIVFNAGLRIKMFGLDVTRKVMVLPEIISRMEKINNKASLLFSQLMLAFNRNQKKVFGLPGGPLHDPLPIVYLIDSEVVELRFVHCDIDISRGPSYGRTNCDMFGYLKMPENTYVAVNVDVQKYWNIIETCLQTYN
jgi:ribosylpyrimidine nucleosidase